MAKNLKNKYPADKAGTKYSEFKNTKRVAPGKVQTRSEQTKQASSVSNASTEQAASKTA